MLPAEARRRVQTIGGIIGKVVEADDEDRILVKVDETSNTKIWFTRNAIHRVLGEEKSAEVPRSRGIVGMGMYYARVSIQIARHGMSTCPCHEYRRMHA